MEVNVLDIINAKFKMQIAKCKMVVLIKTRHLYLQRGFQNDLKFC
jgi:hypothetical protein